MSSLIVPDIETIYPAASLQLLERVDLPIASSLLRSVLIYRTMNVSQQMPCSLDLVCLRTIALLHVNQPVRINQHSSGPVRVRVRVSHIIILKTGSCSVRHQWRRVRMIKNDQTSRSKSRVQIGFNNQNLLFHPIRASRQRTYAAVITYLDGLAYKDRNGYCRVLRDIPVLTLPRETTPSLDQHASHPFH